MNAKVNIVMLAHNRPRLTTQCMRSLGDNTPADLYNLTVIDDASENRVIALDKNTSVLRIENSKGITGQARNLGIYWAEKYWGRGEYLYLTDNDMYFTPGWLEVLTYNLKTLEMGGSPWVLGGWNHPYLQPKDKAPLSARFVSSHDAVAGASQLMSWALWDKYGPLDAHAVGVGQSEDWKFCQDLIKDGGYAGSIYPRVVFNCGITNSLGQLSPGADVMVQELQQAKMQYPNLYWE